MDLPHDLIIYDIISRLPIKSILQFKSVSKQWYFSLSSSNFGNTHFKLSPIYHQFPPVNCVFIQSGNDYFLYSFDEDVEKCDISASYEKGLFQLDIDFDGLFKDDEIIIVGSCNGLLLLLHSLLDYLIIWNPIVKKWSKFSYPLLKSCKNCAWGFGYVTSIDDYKVVRISQVEENILVHVFSLRTQKWKQIYDDKLDDFTFTLHSMPCLAGILINETLYWIMNKRGRGGSQGIFGFDLACERFSEIRGLIPGDSYLSSFRFLGCMGGFLAMVRFTNRGDVSISILKHNGQIEYIGLYRDMDLRSCCAVFGFSKAGKFLIQSSDHELGLVDLSSSPKEYTRVVKFNEQRSIRVLSYTPSLISPDR